MVHYYGRERRRRTPLEVLSSQRSLELLLGEAIRILFPSLQKVLFRPHPLLVALG